MWKIKLKAKANRIAVPHSTLANYMSNTHVITDDELAAWLTHNIDIYFLKHSFKEFKEYCKEIFDADVTRVEFRKFKKLAREKYHE